MIRSHSRSLGPLAARTGAAKLALPAMVIALLSSACAPRRAESPFVVDACPIPPHVTPYTVAASAPEGATSDAALERAVLRSVLLYWEPDDDRVTLAPQTPDEVATMLAIRDTGSFGFGERRPRRGDHALLAVALRRGGGVEPRLVRASGRAGFDASVVTAVRRAVLARETRRVAPDTLPADLPRHWMSDSAVVLLEFGADPKAPPPSVRFVRHETPAVALAGNPVPRYPQWPLSIGQEGEVIVRFAVEPSGRADTASVTVVSTTSPLFADAVLRVLPDFRFRPATVDCEPRRMWVQMPFRFGILPDGEPAPWWRKP